MDISISEAKAKLTDLVRRAHAGEDIVLTRHGRAMVRLAPATDQPSLTTIRDRRLAAIDHALAAARAQASGGRDAARAADFLYDDDGMPA